MNDLNGLSWDSAPAKPKPPMQQPQASSAARSFPGGFLSSSPGLSRQASPLSAAQSGRNTPASNATPGLKSGGANDSFSNLLGSSLSKKANANSLSLSERQRQLAEEKTRQQAEQKQRDDAVWESLERGGASTPSSQLQTNSTRPVQEEEDDILAAFRASAPVDASTNFPPPASSRNRSNVTSPAIQNPVPRSLSKSPAVSARQEDAANDDDDDPFGLGPMSRESTKSSRLASSKYTPEPADNDEDDILGDLGKPVSEARKSRPSASPTMESSNNRGGKETASPPPDTSATSVHPQAKAVAELVDMGFPVERAQEALAHTETGMDVQAAVGWLLNQAHSESQSRSRSRPNHPDLEPLPERKNGPRNGHGRERVYDPALSSGPDKDVAKYASEMGSSFLKSANQLWKTGQKRVQKAMADFQHEGDSSQPRWMQQEPAPPMPSASRIGHDRQHRDQPPGNADASFTDEAAMLEAGRTRPAPPSRREPAPPGDRLPERRPSRQQLNGLASAQMPQRQQQQHRAASGELKLNGSRQPTARLTREAVESQSAEAYISPARRRKAAGTSTPASPAAASPAAPSPVADEPTLDIFGSTPISAPVQKVSATGPAKAFSPSQQSSRMPVRAKQSNRRIPTVSASVLSASASYRQKGTESFKRGDYAEAHTLYTSALSSIPAEHPIAIVLYCNRALTHIKTGDPKAAITDADVALKTIGSSNGEGEFVSLGDSEAEKPMKEFFGKALMRKAEALEHMEKYGEAAKVYQTAVEAGVGGATAAQGRARCEKASGTSSSAGSGSGRAASAPPKTTTARRPPPATAASRARPKPRPSAAQMLNGDSAGGAGGDSAAVKRLREANAAAAAASDEAFALNDAVEARLVAWKAGKEANLRALLASLDTVLWSEAGWTKVNMSDLVMPPRVKIVYMKAIAKTHPDKIATTATTEQRMISASVFAALNEAWDKFKTDNKL